MKATIKIVIGVLCLVFGLFALVTPFTPGSWLIFVGMELLGMGFLIPKKIRLWLNEGWRRMKARLIKAP